MFPRTSFIQEPNTAGWLVSNNYQNNNLILNSSICYLSAFTPKFHNCKEIRFNDDKWIDTESCFRKHFLDKHMKSEKYSDTIKLIKLRFQIILKNLFVYSEFEAFNAHNSFLLKFGVIWVRMHVTNIYCSHYIYFLDIKYM